MILMYILHETGHYVSIQELLMNVRLIQEVHRQVLHLQVLHRQVQVHQVDRVHEVDQVHEVVEEVFVEMGEFQVLKLVKPINMKMLIILELVKDMYLMQMELE